VIPSIELRLDSMRRALQDVIIPAIDQQNSLAIEQAALMLGHIGMIIDQAGKADLFARLCLDDLLHFVEGLAPEGGRDVKAAADELEEAATLSGDSADARYKHLSAALETLIRSTEIDGSEGFRRRLRQGVLLFSKRQAERERVWFAASGFDPSAASLPSIAQMLAERAEAVHGL
jgi:hypothetical protein